MAEGVMKFVGVDWASGAWLAIAYPDYGTPSVKIFTEIDEVWNQYEQTAELIIVDVPIGLCESLHEGDEYRCEQENGKLSRRCDDLARDVIGPRSSSVFTPPAREAAKMAASGKPYEQVNAKNRELTGNGLMQQAANIATGIVQVEELLLTEGNPEILVEGHPEVCFRAFKGEPLQHAKKDAPGVDKRLSALEAVPEYEEETWRGIASDLRAEDHRVKLDDVIDALVLALTACAPEEEFQSLPQEPPHDRKGLPMQMVYRSKEPFNLNSQ